MMGDMKSLSFRLASLVSHTDAHSQVVSGNPISMLSQYSLRSSFIIAGLVPKMGYFHSFSQFLRESVPYRTLLSLYLKVF